MNWKQAFALGLIAPGAWDGKGEPVAYLYNGVRLPKLPEWDRETYPYAWIDYRTEYHSPFGTLVPVGYTEHVWYLRISKTVDTEFFTGVNSIYIEKGTPLYSMEWKEYDDGATSGTKTDWGDMRTLDISNYFPANEYIIWANENIYLPDGTLLISASAPVPIYE